MIDPENKKVTLEVKSGLKEFMNYDESSNIIHLSPTKDDVGEYLIEV